MRVLVTGGAGYIGSTVVSACLDARHEVVVMDDLSTGRREFVAGLLVVGSVLDGSALDEALTVIGPVDAVVHCAARAVVSESVADPVGYYRTNVTGTWEVLTAMVRHGVSRLLFSGSASVYASTPDGAAETSPLAPSSPYARTKAQAEQVIADAATAGLCCGVSLRYFNPIGADPKLRTGLQSPTPSHALGVLMRCWRDGVPFPITGTSWPTRDGTGLRDYVHVWDLARAHVLALERFDDVAPASGPRYRVINLGTGNGVTVRELHAAFERVVGEAVPVEKRPPRPGDVAGSYARADLAMELLGWRAELGLHQGISDSLRWRERRADVLG